MSRQAGGVLRRSCLILRFFIFWIVYQVEAYLEKSSECRLDASRQAVLVVEGSQVHNVMDIVENGPSDAQERSLLFEPLFHDTEDIVLRGR